MRKPQFNSEEEFAEVVVKWLKQNGWEVYQEVQDRAYSGIADIVAKKDNKYWIIECKLNFGFKVMAEADGWKCCANYISVAVPSSKTDMFRRRICSLLDIGVLRVSKHFYKENEFKIEEYLIAKEQTVCHKGLINALTEKHKTYAKAGNNYGKRITPFSNTVDALTSLVKENPGILLKEAVKKISHHYSTNNSAYACIRRYIANGIIKDFEIKYDGRKPTIYLKESK